MRETYGKKGGHDERPKQNISAGENRAKQRQVLMREGNPLRASDFPEAPDECAAYVAKVYLMLMDDRASVITSAQNLFDAVTVHMGLPKESRLSTRCLPPR